MNNISKSETLAMAELVEARARINQLESELEQSRHWAKLWKRKANELRRWSNYIEKSKLGYIGEIKRLQAELTRCRQDWNSDLRSQAGQ